MAHTEVLHYEPSYMFINRVAKIQEVMKKYGQENFYISYSGGKDSTVLSHLIDQAIPGNNIPRVYCNTGIEYIEIVKYVKKKQAEDGRIIIIRPDGKVIPSLQKYGYPFSRKKHSATVATYQRSGLTEGVSKYYNRTYQFNSHNCPEILQYQFEGFDGLKISDKCCVFRKEKPLAKWQKENNKPYSIIGVRAAEGGRRRSAKCEAFKNDKLKAFQPLAVCDDAFIEWYIDYFNIELCSLYYPPFNFHRTGCKGCPFNQDLQKNLEVLKTYAPNEYRHCEYLWKPVYDEYRRIGYRLKPKENQMCFEDYL